MFKNRIARYLAKHLTEAGGQQSPKSSPPQFPEGFIAVPGSLLGTPFHGQMAATADLHRMAFEAAKVQAHEKLLQLLRQRQGLTLN